MEGVPLYLKKKKNHINIGGSLEISFPTSLPKPVFWTIFFGG